MPQNGLQLSLDLQETLVPEPKNVGKPFLVWDWDVEHEDRKRERKFDATLRDAAPFEVDRRVLKDVVKEKMGIEVGRIKFLSAGTFHKAYLVSLVNHVELVARVARRFMPRLKVESEVATMKYLREKTNIPVPVVYHYDSNPYNRLGGEFILMSKAPGIPLAKVFHTLAYNDLVKLIQNTARLIIPLFAHRFSQIGSLYSASPSAPSPLSAFAVSSGAPTPKASSMQQIGGVAFPFLALSAALTPRPIASIAMTTIPSSALLKPPSAPLPANSTFKMGPIISWPFFGSNRGDLAHPHELNRGPWSTTKSYLSSCVEREVQGVIRENEGRSAPHRLHLDPDEILSSRHHRLRAIPGDESDDSDEYNMEESDEECEGPGDVMYTDYRRNQRSTFLFTHIAQRQEAVKREMERWRSVMERLIEIVDKGKGEGNQVEIEEFGLDCHDLSLENVFVDEVDNTKITCIIDWESTTTRPLWACAHLPAFTQSSPFVSKLFRQAVAELPNDPFLSSSSLSQLPPNKSLRELCQEWAYYESAGTKLRMAHRCAEWDGWEEGLVESILGGEDVEEEWFKLTPPFSMDANDSASAPTTTTTTNTTSSDDFSNSSNTSSGIEFGNGFEIQELGGNSKTVNRGLVVPEPELTSNSSSSSISLSISKSKQLLSSSSSLYHNNWNNNKSGTSTGMGSIMNLKNINLQSKKLPFVEEFKKKEQMLVTSGDICGGRGGELGRRLDAWLSVSDGDDGEHKDENNDDNDRVGAGAGVGVNDSNGTGKKTTGKGKVEDEIKRVTELVLRKDRWVEGQRTVV